RDTTRGVSRRFADHFACMVDTITQALEEGLDFRRLREHAIAGDSLDLTPEARPFFLDRFDRRASREPSLAPGLPERVLRVAEMTARITVLGHELIGRRFIGHGFPPCR